MPNMNADCPGVIDYICGPPSMLSRKSHGGFDIIPSPPDLSDHHPTPISIRLDDTHLANDASHVHLKAQRLAALEIPTDTSSWESIERDVSSQLEEANLKPTLQSSMDSTVDPQETQRRVDNVIDKLTSILYDVFYMHKLVKKRSFGAHRASTATTQKAAPPPLRHLRLHASAARRSLVNPIRTNAPAEAVSAAKKTLNRWSFRCCQETRAVRANLCTSWSTLWLQLQHSSPRQL